MFTGLKNKIKEETGSDPTKLSLSSPPQKITHGSAPKGHHSRQGSGSSLGSLSLDGVREELVSSPSVLKQDTSEIKLPDGKVLNQKEVKRLEKREDEWRRKLQKVEEDWTKKLEKKEEEWKKQVEEKQRDWRRSIELLEKEKVALEEEKREIVQQKLNLEEALKAADEYKKKVIQYQEDIEQLEGLQTQEMAKIKHLVLVGNENEGVKTRLFEAEKRLREVETEFAHISIALEDEKSSNTALHLELAQLRDALEAEQTRSANLSISLNRERGEKDVTLLRNAQVNQQVELAKQELREQEQEAVELHNKIIVMEKILADKDMAIEKMKIDSEELSKRVQDTEMVEHDKQAAANLEQELRNNISELEEQLIEKNKNIRVLQQRLSDMKKTLQHELRLPTQSVHGTGTTESDSFIPAAVLTPSSSRHLQQKQHQQPVTNHRMTTEDDDVNFKYLKHVLIKFLTSREYEAQHLTRAVATLLRFSPEEE
ncbi:hypothetical protein B7P43_G13037, partial [Cryptotermes secundus]